MGVGVHPIDGVKHLLSVLTPTCNADVLLVGSDFKANIGLTRASVFKHSACGLVHVTWTSVGGLQISTNGAVYRQALAKGSVGVWGLTTFDPTDAYIGIELQNP